ncbi:MAG: transposase [Melioribacteraceae bacterium]|nr:transposase [Melioribacteraceae bacterium]
MNLIELSKYLQDEQAAEDYLYEKEILKRFTVCPHCGSNKLGHISRGRIKCYKCKKEWHKRKGSFLEGKKISAGILISILKMFSSGYSANHISKELSLDYKTANEICEKIRQIILKNHFVNINFLKEEYFLFQVNNSDDTDVLICETIPIQDKKFLSYAYGKLILKRTKTYDDLLTFSFNFTWISKPSKRKIYQVDRFLSYLSQRLHTYRGVNYDKFISYLCENLIRFNIGEEAFFLKIFNEILKGG